MKEILTSPGSAVLAALTGVDRLHWLNVETPRVRNLRVDLLGEVPQGELIQIEFESRNAKDLPFRMLEYLGAVGRVHRRLPRQIVLYVGEAPLRMEDSITGPGSSVRYHLVDVRDLDGEVLLRSPNLGDNVIALLTRFGENPKALGRIVEKILSGPPEARDQALGELFILAGLRRKRAPIARELTRMPIRENIMHNPIIGPWLRESKDEGHLEGQQDIVMGLIAKRFGVGLPADLQARLAGLGSEELRAISLRLLDVSSIDELFLN